MRITHSQPQQMIQNEILHPEIDDDIQNTFNDIDPTISPAYQAFLKHVKLSNAFYRKNSVKSFRQSTYQCLGKQNMLHSNEGRSCIFTDICYNTQSKEYQFYQPTQQPIFYDHHHGPIYDFPKKFIALNALHIFHSGQYFSPKVVVEDFPLDSDDDTVHLDKLFVIWSNWAAEYNFGHLAFEELGMVYINMKRFKIDDTDAQLLNYRNPKTTDHLYAKFTRFINPAISSLPIQNHKSFLDTYADKSRVCFKKLLVSSPSRLFLDYSDSSNEGKETIWRDFRDQILKVNSLDPMFRPKSNDIRLVFFKKSDTQHASSTDRTSFRGIANLDQLVSFAKDTWPHLKIEVLDPSRLSLKEQLQKMQQTSILVTPNGGISMIAPFLPENSHVILMDYYVSKHAIYNAYIPYKVGDSGSMEISFWNLFPHLHKHYYQILDPRMDMVWDVEGSTNARDDASVMIHLERFEFMMHHILYELANARDMHVE